ncbi:ATP-binding protein [Halorarius litoreus]|uniref:ATP-binding protein n=1 Tax=Halorarius litoreus TaxID=2962676 RepID=UPI0020CBCD1A|nr:PAS domain-containing sensor histidine kinase [Halorarius litoreus]
MDERDVDSLAPAYVDALPTLFFVLDTSGRLVDWNRQLESITGDGGEPLRGRRLASLVAEPDTESVGDWLTGVFDDERTATAEFAVATNTDESVPHRFEAGPLVDDHGAVVGAVGTASDVSAERARLREYEAKAARFERFAAIVSHDLRNPLAVADGYLDLARSDAEFDHLEHVEAAHDRMWDLIDTLLQLEQDDGELDDVEAVDLNGVVTDAWTGVTTERASLSVVGDLGTVQGNRERLGQLFENLFRNSVEHGSTVEQGDAGVTVTVRPTATGFCVVDDGPGLPEGRDDLFADGVTTKPGGTGLGLAIVASVAEAHGWTVEASESESGGARFDVRTE